jgi:uncharacterized repeat protein (TIGR01451 family)
MIRIRATFIFLILLMLARVTPAGKAEEDYVNNLPQPAPITSKTVEVQQELESRVAEMVSLGHLAPTLYFIGLGSGENLGWPAIFYATPSETIYTLSAAYPYLSDSLKGQVKAYLDSELQAYPPHAQGYYAPNAGQVSDLVGAKREYFTPDPDQSFNFWPGIPVHISTLYSVWLYSYNTGDWSYTTNNYSALKSIYTDFKNTNSITSYPELAGVIGFARMAQHLGQSADYEDAFSFAEDGFASGADFDQFLSTAQSRYPGNSHSYTTPIFMFNRNPVAVHFNRDIGQFLRDQAGPAVAAYAESVSQDVPLWWLTGVALSHGENAYTTPEISWTNLLLHAYVLDTPTEQLKQYLDAPDRKGDLLYIQKLIAVIEAFAAPNLHSSSKTALNPVPQSGQTVTYTISIRNTGLPITHTTHLTDVIPAGLAYVPNTLTASLGVADDSAFPTLYWSGVLSDTPAVVITYAANVTVPPDTIQIIQNSATINAGSDGLVTRTATIIVNGYTNYLPIILKRAS